MTKGSPKKSEEIKESVIEGINLGRITCSDGSVRTPIGNRKIAPGQMGIVFGSALFIGSQPETQILLPSSPFPEQLLAEALQDEDPIGL